MSSLRILSLFFVGLLSLSAQETWHYAPNPKARPLNQLKASGNACGPTCLLNASRLGGKKWQKSFAAIPGTNDKTRILSLINKYGKVRSRHFPTRLRYSPKNGINISDLLDMANDMRLSVWQAKLDYRLLFRNENTSSTQQLQETHALLKKSLSRGYPPILHLQRMVRRKIKNSEQIMWVTVKSHFVVLTGLPDHLPRGAASFRITYLDPWGGRNLQGIISVPAKNFRTLPVLSSKRVVSTINPNLVAIFPKTRVGLSLVRKNEAPALTLASTLGDF